MRGGLGKNLLIAFLLLATIPLALLAFLIYVQVQRDSSQKLLVSLETMAALKEANLVSRVDSQRRELALLASTFSATTEGSRPLVERQAGATALDGWMVIDRDSGEIVTGDGTQLPLEALNTLLEDGQTAALAPLWLAKGQARLATQSDWAGYRLVGLFDKELLRPIVFGPTREDDDTTTYLLTTEGLLISPAGIAPLSPTEEETVGFLQEGRSGSGAYTNLAGTEVFGAWRWSPELGVTLVVEQAQIRALETGNTLTAVVVGGTLAVALLTAATAAVVTRRITRPIVQLTETAAWMARGDLDQQVTITRQDEIGVLARAFNRMAADLRVLYGNLEAKVTERTQQLEVANERIRHHAMQLALSAEVARVISSIRDRDELLDTVTELIKSAFELHHVAVYLVDENRDGPEWQKGESSGAAARHMPVDRRSLPEQVISEGRRLVARTSAPGKAQGGMVELQPPVTCELAIPLRHHERLLGVIDLQSTRPQDFYEDDQMVYQSLANQISIALENAQAYAVERETVRKLTDLDRIQVEFLRNMSHALRTPLTSILGFSQVMLKELDGPLNEIQRTDLMTIHDNGKHLLGMLDDMLELSQLQLGTAPFAQSNVDLTEILAGVMATAQAVARGKPVQLSHDIAPNLPLLQTDGQRVRQVLLALVTNAVRFTDQGTIHLQASATGQDITISVTDTGAVLSQADQARLFSNTSNDNGGGRGDVPGFGLVISRQMVERLGGQIWLDSEEGVGSTFTFTLPLIPPAAEPNDGAASYVDKA